MTSSPQHWDAAYDSGHETRGWYQASAVLSRVLIRDTGLPHDCAIIDIGGGASVLVDDLLADGYTDITVLDHSPAGLQVARDRLGDRAADVTWVTADLRTWTPERTYAVWHDRAVLHFLLADDDIAAYRARLLEATGPGSWAVIGIFGPEGPAVCAGLPVRQYDESDLEALLEPDFEIAQMTFADHVRPDGEVQQFLWALAQRT